MLQSRNVLLIACAVLMVTAVLANAAVKYINLQVLIENDRRVAHTREVKDRLNEMLKNFLDCESSVRGYVLGGREDFLKPYHAAIERVEREFRGVSNLVSDNPEQLGAMAELRKNYDAHQEFLRDILTAHRESGEQTAREIVRTGRGKAIMDEMRRRILEMTRHEDTLLETREQTAKEGLRRALLSGAIGTVLSLAIAVAAIVVVSQELYRRRAAEELLKTQIEETRINAERFRLLTQSVPVCIWTARPDGSVTFLNERWRSYTGLPIDESGCATWLDAIHPDDVDRLSAVWGRAEGRGDDLYAQEVRVRRGADQTYRWHHCSIVPIRTRRGELQSWVGSLTDVQDQKDQADALEQAVRFRTQELRRANNALQEEVLERIRAEDRVSAVAAELRRSNEELEKFAYVASHDLQEPLRKIQAFGDRLLRKCRDQLDDAGRGYLDRMLAAATRMRTLIDDLLVFSRVATQTRPYVSVDLHATVSEIVADLEAAVQQSGGRVELHTLPTVEADPLQMRQLFQNLIGNALKFAKPELPPAVVIDAEPLAAVPATADPPAPSFPGWRIRVADNGIGFDQIHERRIFELFQRLHGREQFAGTGIGLAICRKIVERHGGVMHARSADARFRSARVNRRGCWGLDRQPIELTELECLKRRIAVMKAPALAPNKSGRPVTILMADDDADDRQMTKEAFEEARLANELRFVEDGIELLDYLNRRGKYSDPASSPMPSLILLDLNMPRKDGREALEEIKADPRFRAIRVVILTTSKAEADIVRSYNLSAASYITKPVTFEALVDVIRTLGKYWLEIVELPSNGDDAH